MKPRPVQTRLPRTEATVKIYENEIVLSEATVRLLQLNDTDPLVAFMIDRDAEMLNRKRLYVAGAPDSWPIKYVTVAKGKRRLVRCRDLARRLAEDLDGYGVYRVCVDDSYAENGIIWYNIFFRRYD